MLPFLSKHWLRRYFHVYTILLKYAGIASIHILLIANISVPHAMQLAATWRVWVDNVKLQTSFLARTRF